LDRHSAIGPLFLQRTAIPSFKKISFRTAIPLRTGIPRGFLDR
jgi:hypothetical protein